MGFLSNVAECYRSIPGEVRDIFSKDGTNKTRKALLVTAKIASFVACAAIFATGCMCIATGITAAVTLTPIGLPAIICTIAYGAISAGLSIPLNMVYSNVLGVLSRDLAQRERYQREQANDNSGGFYSHHYRNNTHGNTYGQRRDYHQERNRTHNNNPTYTYGLNSRKRCFQILELPENATKAQVKSQYRKLAKTYHPDRVLNDHKESTEEIRNEALKEADAKFKEIKKAYDLLMADFETKESNVKKTEPDVKPAEQYHTATDTALVSI